MIARLVGRITFPCLLLGALLAGELAAHPIHSTLTEVSYDSDGDRVEVLIRVFADDFGSAVGRAHPGQPTPMARYIASRLIIRDRRGQPIPLRWVEARRTDEVIWIRMRGTSPAGLRGATVRNELVFDLFDDQVNIVKARYRGEQHTLLFTRDARVRKLP